MTRTKFCEEHHSICVKMGHAIVKANAFMHQRPKEAMALLGKRLNVKDPKILAQADEDTLVATPSPPVTDIEGLSRADDLNIGAGFMKASDKPASYAKMFTNEFLK
jgi:ABC-type nitrate/sulfonate/bicarbonate transport system substrate-binding protein